MTDTPRVRAETPPEPGTRPAPSVVDVVSVLCGVLAFGTLALWGFTAWEFPWNLVYGIGAPVVAVLLWALFVSPRAVLAVHPFVRAVVELLVYLSATIAWWSMGQPWIGLGYAVVAVAFGLVAGRRRLG
jgi:hypothetical protein